jgi:hypothetical protein
MNELMEVNQTKEKQNIDTSTADSKDVTTQAKKL